MASRAGDEDSRGDAISQQRGDRQINILGRDALHQHRCAPAADEVFIATVKDGRDSMRLDTGIGGINLANEF
jgi:hypothetical protein